MADIDPNSAATAVGKVLSRMMGQASPDLFPTDPFGAGAGMPTFDVSGQAQPTQTSVTTGAAEPDSSLKLSQGYGGPTGHPGYDIAVPNGTPLLAAEAGTVTAAGNTDPNGYGNEVEITGPDGTVIRYGHLSNIGVKVGDQVKPGQSIGASGGIKGAPGSGNADGPHLHFEVRQGGHSVDPAPWLASNAPIIGTGSSSTTTTTTPTVTTIPSAAASGATAATQISQGLSAQPIGQSNQSTTQQAAVGNVSTVSSGGADNDPNALGSFLSAIRQHESGGNYSIYNQSGLSNASGAYQFIGSTWRGLGGTTANAAQASPAEQDAIAAKYAQQLFDEFHSWRLAAIAWYGGPGVAQQVAAGNNPGSPQGQASYLAYGDQIASMMSGGK